MREIKCRAWHKEYRAWIKCFYPLTSGIETEMTIIGVQGDEDEDLMMPDDVEIVWYTGLKDKNGVEIFEGDIVKFHYWKKDYVLPVKWGTDGWWISGFGWYKELYWGQDRCEVIGNIYENPELLK